MRLSIVATAIIFSLMALAGRSSIASSAENATSNSQENSNGLAEIIVTAQKREERLFDVPINIVALGGDELQKRVITNIDDLTLVVPGINSESTGWQRRMNLQGVINGSGLWPSIGIYLDEANITTSIPDVVSVNTFDLERVEVLKGPQGTLYGEGSEGGTIRFIAKSPDLMKSSLVTDVAAMFTQGGAPSQRINALINSPLIDNVLGLRIAGTFDHEGGWIDQVAADRKNINSQNLADVRAKGLWKPNSQLTISAMAEIHRNDTSTNEGEDSSGNYTQTFGLTTTPSVKDYFDIYNATITYDFSSIRVLNTTSYVNQDTKTIDFGYRLEFFPLSTGTPFDVYQNPYEQINKSLSDELRIASTGPEPWQWSVGASYRRISADINQAYLFAEEPATPAGNSYFPNATSAVSRGTALFADTNYKISDRLTVGAGARYYHDDQSYVAASGGAPATYQTGTFHSVDPRVYILLSVSKDVNVYANASKGFRSGGFNSFGEANYGPETIWTYQLGSKLAVLDNHLRLDMNIFYTDYKGYQQLAILPPPAQPINEILNDGTVGIKGIDATVEWNPVKEWTYSLRADYIDSKFTNIPFVTPGVIVGEGFGNPKYVFSTSAQRDFVVIGKEGFARLDYNHQGTEISINPGNSWANQQIGIVQMLNLNTGLNLSKSLRVGLFIQNLLNDRGQTALGLLPDSGTRSRPRTLGIQFSNTFE